MSPKSIPHLESYPAAATSWYRVFASRISSAVLTASMAAATIPCLRMALNAYVQRNQPPGVPPLELTGERTLPDVPAENYWYRRHLAVYEWIGARVVGQRVLDMACGEGYGSEVLARGAASVVGVDANPEAFEHARLRYRRQNLTFERGIVESFGGAGGGERGIVESFGGT